MVCERAEITLGVRIQTFVEKFGNYVTFNLERTSGDIHKSVKAFIEIGFVDGLICYSRHIDGNDADRTRAFAAAEETTRFFAELAKIETQPAAHTSYVAGLHIAVNIVAEIRSTVFSRHFKQ